MSKTSFIIHNSSDKNTWAQAPGVVCGCDVFIHDGSRVGVKPGRLNLLNGYTAEILSEIRGVARVLPTDGTNRIDYVTVNSRGSEMNFHCIRGYPADVLQPNDHSPLTLRNGLLLAKIYASHPLVSAESIRVYNIVPVVGEGTVRGFRPLTYPDGITRKFTFPFQLNTGFSLRLELNGIPQSEVEDYIIYNEIQLGGMTMTVVEFIIEAPAKDSEMIATAYKGKTRL